MKSSQLMFALAVLILLGFAISLPAHATTPLSETMTQAGTQVMEGGQNLWERILSPILNRLISSIPLMINALVMLLFFWILAKIGGALVTKVLGVIRLDERAMRDWGLGKTLMGSSGQKRSLEKLCGDLTKWIILLFGVIAFLQVLNLEMVATPLQNILDNILAVIPNLLKGFLILLVYWVVATIVKLAIVKTLTALRTDERVKKYFPAQRIQGESVPPSELTGRVFFYAILLFSIPPFLQALGQESLVSPLQTMLGKTLGFIPNVFAALLILFVGYLLATIVREIVTNFIAGLGADAGAERLGLDKVIGKKNISQIIGVIFYFFILVPVIVSAVDTLEIKAISEPVKHTLELILTAIPSILVATLIMIVGYVIAKSVRGLVTNFLSGVGFDALPGKLGLDFLKPKKDGAPLSRICGTIVLVIILLLTAEQALATLRLDQLASVINVLILYLPKFFTGIVILFAALSIGTYIGGIVDQATQGSIHNKLVSAVAKYTIVFFGASMALHQLGVGEEIITVAVSAVLGGAALALGLAFGLGGKDKAKAFLEKGK